MPRVSVICSHATGLRSTQTFGKQDPYVKVIHGRAVRKTRVDENGSRTPNWGEQLLDMGKIPLGSTLKLEVWNENNMSDCVIGVASMQIATSSYRNYVALPLSHKGKSAGMLNIELSITPDDAPLTNTTTNNSTTATASLRGVALAQAGTQLFLSAVAIPVMPVAEVSGARPPPPQAPQVAMAYATPPTPQGGAHFVSQDKSVINLDASHDIVVPLGAGSDLTVGLGWDFADRDGDGQGDTDLDLSCVAFDNRGQFVNACYFADSNPFGNRAVFHTGDNRDGKGDGDDETIILDLDLLVQAGISSLFFVVNSFNGSTFRDVKSAHSRLVANQTRNELSYVTMSMEDRRATSLITGRLSLNNGSWILRPMAVSGKNTCFADVVPEMQKRLGDILGRVKIAPPPAGIIMTKGESLAVPSSHFKVGLGWDQVGRPVDLDASVVCLRQNLTLSDACFFGKLKVYGGALQHSGDNQTGAGSGDDESVTVNLSRLPADVAYVCVVVNCYDDSPLSNVRNAYVRLLDASGRAESHRYNLSSLGGLPGYLMCTIYKDRHTNAWMLKTNSKEATGNTYKAMLPAIQQAANSLYSKHV
jgi:stress response protein SCP2